MKKTKKTIGITKQEKFIASLYYITDSLEDCSPRNIQVEITELIEYMVNKNETLNDQLKRKKFEQDILKKLETLVIVGAIYFPKKGFVRRLRQEKARNYGQQLFELYDEIVLQEQKKGKFIIIKDLEKEFLDKNKKYSGEEFRLFLDMLLRGGQVFYPRGGMVQRFSTYTQNNVDEINAKFGPYKK